MKGFQLFIYSNTQALGASDYLQMSRVFHTLILRDIPVLNELRKSAARRFITLIDTLYDNKVRAAKLVYIYGLNDVSLNIVTRNHPNA